MGDKKMALPPQQFCVRWNSYHTNLQAVFPRLLLTEQFADVTLACESKQLRCHKLVLSACSAYLERLLTQNPCKHPIVLMRDMRFSEMQALVDFMYKGEVNVTQEELPSLLRSAEALQIRGLCSNDTAGLSEFAKQDSKDYTVASEALVANARRDNEASTNGPAPAPTTAPPTATAPPPAAKPRPVEDRADVKEETVEEDGLYYGELDAEQMEYNEDEEPGKPGSSLGQASDADYAIANVQCHYGTEEDSTQSETLLAVSAPPVHDHTYGTKDEPPAYIIQQMSTDFGSHIQVTETDGDRPEDAKIMTLGPGGTGLKVIHVGDRPQHHHHHHHHQPPPEYPITKRIRRSEELLSQAAACVRRGSTFQTVSDHFRIPISTIRFFMSRKGILPQRRRGRNTQLLTQSIQSCRSPEPPFHMQHYKLPDMVALTRGDEDTRMNLTN